MQLGSLTKLAMVKYNMAVYLISHFTLFSTAFE